MSKGILQKEDPSVQGIPETPYTCTGLFPDKVQSPQHFLCCRGESNAVHVSLRSFAAFEVGPAE